MEPHVRPAAGDPRYLESVANDFDLRRHLILQTRVRTMRWNEDTSQWELELERDDHTSTTLVADVVVSAVGLFSAAKRPDIDGLADYRGILLHTSHWKPEVDLSGTKVAVIGTGASAVQAVPELARIAKEVIVFQRTPPWMVPKDDRPFAAEELSRFRRHPWAARRERWRIWKQFHDFSGSAVDDPTVMGHQQIALTFLQRTVSDEHLREALTPDYPFRCKRVLLGDDYYRSLQQENVELVTTPIRRATPSAVVTDDERACGSSRSRG